MGKHHQKQHKQETARDLAKPYHKRGKMEEKPKREKPQKKNPPGKQQDQQTPLHHNTEHNTIHHNPQKLPYIAHNSKP